MSAKKIRNGIEVHNLGMRLLYVKASTGFVLRSDDLTAGELLAIACDIAERDRDGVVPADVSSPQAAPTDAHSRTCGQ